MIAFTLIEFYKLTKVYRYEDTEENENRMRITRDTFIEEQLPSPTCCQSIPYYKNCVPFFRFEKCTYYVFLLRSSYIKYRII